MLKYRLIAAIAALFIIGGGSPLKSASADFAFCANPECEVEGGYIGSGS